MSRKQELIIWFVLVVFGSVFLSKLVLTPTKGRMSWALADHYAVSLGFLDNHFDFFHPETYSLNPQFPPTKLSNSDSKFFSFFPENPRGITAIDFPINHYIVALLMKVFDSDSFVIYRMYTLFLSLLSIFFLSKASFLVTKSYKFSVLLVLAILTAPVYTNYSSSSLPGPISCSILFISFYCYVLYTKFKNIKHFLLFLCLITLASLNRFPFVIYLVAILCSLVASFILGKKQQKGGLKFITSLAGLLIVLGYFIYNKWYLSYHYGSIMLSAPTPTNNLNHTLDVLKDICIRISWRYGTIVHYLFLMIVLITLYKNRTYVKKIKELNFSIIYILVISIGVMLYALLMFRQFRIHGYYILDTFFPLLIFWAILLYNKIDSKYKMFARQHFFRIGILLLFLGKLHYFFGFERIVNHPTSRFEKTVNNFEKSSQTLDDLGISKDSKLLFLDQYTNLAFTGLKRKSFVVYYLTKENIKKALSWKYDYIVTQNFSFKQNVLSNYPNFMNETKIFFSNDKYTIHTKK